jgi:hypothetical protein
MNISETPAGTSAIFAAEYAEALAQPFSSATQEKLSIRVADTLPALEELRPFWNQWAVNLSTDLDYFLHKLKIDPTVIGPYVLTTWNEGVPQAILVGQIRRHRVSSVISFVNVQGPKVNALEILNGGRLGPQSAASDRLFVLHLKQLLRNSVIDLLCFSRLAKQSELFRQLQQVEDPKLKERTLYVPPYSFLSLIGPGGARTSSFSGKNKREARRKTRLLERAFPGKARFKVFSGYEEMDDGLRDASAVDLTTWQHSLRCSLLDAPRVPEDLTFCAQRGWLRIYLMYVEERPVAFFIGKQYKDMFYSQFAGYRPDFAGYSVGSLLTTWAFENLAATGVTGIDLGEGGQEHNRRWGCEIREIETVHLYSPTLRGQCLRMFFTVTETVRSRGRQTRDVLGLNRAARVWSRFLFGH